MTVRPRIVGPRLLVKPLEAAEATHYGIVLPESARVRESRGLVMQVPEEPHLSVAGIEREPPCEVGDVVVWDDSGNPQYGRAAPIRVLLDLDETGHQEEFVVLGFSEVLIVLEDVKVSS